MSLERPIVCLVTDRRRLTHQPSGPMTLPAAALAGIARPAAEAGVDLIQIREPDMHGADLARAVAAVVDATRGSRTRVIVNDRLDVALASGAHGVHLRADSIPPQAARSIAPPGFLIGRSVHTQEEAREHAAAVDYLIAGTVFPTTSKPAAARLLGIAGLKAIASAVRVPVIAIGGISVGDIGAIASAGAAGIAGISVFLPGGSSIAAIVNATHRQFDRLAAAP